MHLRNPNFVPIMHCLTTVLIGTYYTCSLARLIFLYHTIINDMKLIIKHNVAIYLLNDIVLNKHEPINVDVYRKAICVEAGTNFLVNLDKNIICWFFYRSLAVFFGYGVN